MRQTILPVFVTALLIAFAACSVPATEPVSEPSTSAQDVPPLPPRPHDVDLVGLDPCALLTQDQQRELGITRPPALVPDSDPFHNDYCTYLSDPPGGWSLGGVTQEDPTVYFSGDRDVVARLVVAAGFPAVEYRNPRDAHGCFVGVSTSSGQYLNVQYEKPDVDAESDEAACGQARRAAEMAVQTLLAQRG